MERVLRPNHPLSLNFSGNYPMSPPGWAEPAKSAFLRRVCHAARNPKDRLAERSARRSAIPVVATGIARENRVTRRRSGEGWRAAALWFCLLIGLFGPGTSAAADAVPGESEVKAAFVLNFIKFVEWPASAFHSKEDPIVLAVLGKDPVGDAILGLHGKSVSRRTLVVRKTTGHASLGEYHILYVGASAQAELPAALREAHQRAVLTIADFEGFAGKGGMIGFIRQDDRVGFEINEEASREAGLKINARLLYLGRSVRGRLEGDKK
jgi:hypothetical protein